MTSSRIYAANRIKELRQAKGLSLEEVGARMRADLTASTISKLENRRMALSLDYLVDIASVLEVPPSEIIQSFGISGIRTIPVAGRIAAGNWRESVQMSDESISVPQHLAGSSLFALRPFGDSMDRLVQDGGFIVVDPEDRELRDRKFYAVANGDGETTFKQFSANPMQLLPCSTNPEHQPIPLGSEPFTVIGRVIYVGQDL